MTKALYDGGREGFLDGSIDWDTHEFRVVLIDEFDYTVDLATHRTLDAIPAAARVAVSGALTGKTVAAGVADADNVTFISVSGDPAEALVIYQHALTQGGAALAETSARLVCYINETSNASLPVTPDGRDIKVVWQDTDPKIFKL